eukprot:356275-Chlamydomonas_euryale.AAC.4
MSVADEHAEGRPADELPGELHGDLHAEYVASIRECANSALVGIRTSKPPPDRWDGTACCHKEPACVRSHHYASAHISMHPLTSACVRSNQHASAHITMRPLTSACIRSNQHASAHITMRPLTSACIRSNQHAILHRCCLNLQQHMPWLG